jgi:phospholipid/cholesterol/gamma-HCH transport system permease protein
MPPPSELFMDAERPLRASFVGGRIQLMANGPWIAAQAAEIDAAVAALDTPASPAVLDCTGIERLDTSGAWLIEAVVRRWRSAGHDCEIVGVPERFAGLVHAVHSAAPKSEAAPAQRASVAIGLADIGRRAESASLELMGLVGMLGTVVAALVRVVREPRAFRLTSMVHHLDRVGWQAVPIILLITVLIGGIIAQQGFFHFRKFDADAYVVDMVGILVLREIGVLIVAIMVAGRSGSSYTAELGSMKMREEIDALRTMGRDPIEVLILPRILALLLALPMLTFLGSMSALFGGGVVAWSYGDMSPEIFIARLKEAISTTHFEVGMIKAPFMALVIGLVACTEGLKVRGSAESLGRQTTSSVVQAIFLVIVLDGLFAVFFASIGM